MFLAVLSSIVLGSSALAGDGDIFKPSVSSHKLTLGDMVAQIPRGSVIVVGEQHDLQAHHDKQIQLVEEVLHQQGTADLALEFFDFTQQSALNDYLSGRKSEEEFLSSVKMTPDVFNFYKPIMRRIYESGGRVIGSNLPRYISGKISKLGMEGLTQEDLSFLPPQFELGQPLYLERFSEAMNSGHKLAPEKLQKFFQAQSAWDETMAYQGLKNRRGGPVTLIQVVGNFHVEYNLGLPVRYRKRAVGIPVKGVPQVNAGALRRSEVEGLIAKDPRYGFYGDFVWISGESSP